MTPEEREQVLHNSVANCRLCKTTPVPEHFGSPRVCAWDADGNFNQRNWNCVTANMLRDACGESWDPQPASERLYLRRDDHSYGCVYIPPHPEDCTRNGTREGPWRGGGLIAMTWYKHHGGLDAAFVVDHYRKDVRLTLEEAEAAIENLKAAGI